MGRETSSATLGLPKSTGKGCTINRFLHHGCREQGQEIGAITPGINLGELTLHSSGPGDSSCFERYPDVDVSTYGMQGPDPYARFFADF